VAAARTIYLFTARSVRRRLCLARLPCRDPDPHRGEPGAGAGGPSTGRARRGSVRASAGRRRLQSHSTPGSRARAPRRRGSLSIRGSANRPSALPEGLSASPTGTPRRGELLVVPIGEIGPSTVRALEELNAVATPVAFPIDHGDHPPFSVGFPPFQRSDLKAARTSSQKSSGSSHAAKCPPLSTSLK